MRSTAALLAPIVALLVFAQPSLAAGDWTWPVRGEVVTQYRNGDDPYAAGQHRGVDIAAPSGTPVVAATAGTVLFSGVVGSSGVTVSQRSADGRYVLSYLHLSATAVRAGQPVEPGMPLGAVGTSGTRPVAESHLHFGVRASSDRHAYLDPLPFLAPTPPEAPQPRPVPAPVPVEAPAPPLAIPGFPAPGLAPAPAAAGPEPTTMPAAAPAPWGFATPVPFAPPANGPASRPRTAPVSAAGAHPSSAAVGRAGRHPAAPGAGPGRSAQSSPRRPLAGPDPESRLHAGHSPARSGRDTPAAGRDLDVGWLVACAALVAASMLLAGPRRGRPAVRPGRAAVAALLRAGR